MRAPDVCALRVHATPWTPFQILCIHYTIPEEIFYPDVYTLYSQISQLHLILYSLELVKYFIFNQNIHINKVLISYQNSRSQSSVNV